jgi:hypothetical protein
MDSVLPLIDELTPEEKHKLTRHLVDEYAGNTVLSLHRCTECDYLEAEKCGWGTTMRFVCEKCDDFKFSLCGECYKKDSVCSDCK